MTKRIPDEELLNDLHRVADIVGSSPSQPEYSRHGNYSKSTIQRRFGSWNEALIEAGLAIEKRDEKKFSDSELIADLQQVAKVIGETPSADQYDEFGKHGSATLTRRFGGWNAALRRADLEIKEEYAIEPIEYLRDIRREASGRIAPSQGEYGENGTYNARSVNDRVDRWWQAVVRAGLKPASRRPLEPAVLHDYFQTVNRLPPLRSLPILLAMFTGLNSETIGKIEEEWLRDNRDRNIVRVPPEHNNSNRPWLFRLPETWYNPYKDERMDTGIPEAIDWVFNYYDEIPLGREKGVILDYCLRAGIEAGIEDREWKAYDRRYNIKEAPVIRPSDLTYTYGVNLVRQGMDSDDIDQRLGINRSRKQYSIYLDDLFLWAYVHHGYNHPDYNPTGIFIDPDTGDIWEIDSEWD